MSKITPTTATPQRICRVSDITLFVGNNRLSSVYPVMAHAEQKSSELTAARESPVRRLERLEALLRMTIDCRTQEAVAAEISALNTL
jgi:hypothetical protein